MDLAAPDLVCVAAERHQQIELQAREQRADEAGGQREARPEAALVLHGGGGGGRAEALGLDPGPGSDQGADELDA
ncbi:MAG: hypothetical protein IPJ34_20225 [Myxococcales bacterium]|nr:hypothetical protein [Myxococcales bacterium]